MAPVSSPLPPSSIPDRAGRHRPCAESMSGLDCSRKRRERKKGRAEGEEKKLFTKKKKKKLEEGDVGVEGGDLWGTFITTQRCPGETKEEGRRERGKTFPFPFLSVCLYRSHTGGGELCLRRRGRGGFTQERCIELGWNKHGARKGAGFTGSARRNVNKSGCRGDSRPAGWRGRAWAPTLKEFYEPRPRGVTSPWSVFTDDRVGRRALLEITSAGQRPSSPSMERFGSMASRVRNRPVGLCPSAGVHRTYDL